NPIVLCRICCFLMVSVAIISFVPAVLESPSPIVDNSAQGGGIASGGNVSGNAITINGQPSIIINQTPTQAPFLAIAGLAVSLGALVISTIGTASTVLLGWRAERRAQEKEEMERRQQGMRRDLDG